MTPARAVAFKVDVDTHDGMRYGVPVLLEIFRRFCIRATFCLAFGPDNAGKAVSRLLKDPAFLKKMLRTGALNCMDGAPFSQGLSCRRDPRHRDFRTLCVGSGKKDTKS